MEKVSMGQIIDDHASLQFIYNIRKGHNERVTVTPPRFKLDQWFVVLSIKFTYHTICMRQT